MRGISAGGRLKIVGVDQRYGDGHSKPVPDDPDVCPTGLADHGPTGQ